MPRGQSFAGYAGSDPFKERSENRQHPNGAHASDLSRQTLEDATTVAPVTSFRPHHQSPQAIRLNTYRGIERRTLNSFVAAIRRPRASPANRCWIDRSIS